jgi:cytochrome oxidase assembly protein ShyY1
VSLTVQSKGFFRAVFLDYWFLFVAVLAIVAIVIMRRRSRAKSKKKIDKGK